MGAVCVVPVIGWSIACCKGEVERLIGCWRLASKTTTRHGEVPKYDVPMQKGCL